MKSTIIALFFACALCVTAQTNPPTFINGSLEIKYNTKLQSSPTVGISDTYAVNVNVCNSAIFRGTITQTPLIIGGLLNSAQQLGSLKYDMWCDVVNPANPAQTKQVGKITGLVPIDQDGVYRYQDGTLHLVVNPIGQAQPIDSKFGGLAFGKPPIKAKGLLDSLDVSKLINGKTVTLKVKKYDKMEFRQHTLAPGPVQLYQEVTVNGKMIYDYDRGAWYFKDLTVSYQAEGLQKVDRISGSILWHDDADRKKNGEGWYEFDVRVNEPSASEGAVFAAPTDEASFFTTDPTIAALTGTWKYHDTLNGDTTTASSVKIDLVGNKLTKQQAMVLCKLLVFSTIVPMNSD